MTNTTANKAVNTKTKSPESFFIVKESSLYDVTDAGGAVINAAIVSGMKKLNTVQIEFQRIACSVLLHVAKHGDIRIVRNLFEKMEGSMANTTSMKKWFDLYAPVTFDDTGEVHYSKDKLVKLADAMTRAWWKAKPPTPYAGFILSVEIKKLYEKAVAKLEEKDPVKAAANQVDLETLAKLGDLYNAQEIQETEELNEPEQAIAA